MSLVAEKLIAAYCEETKSPYIPIEKACDFLGLAPASAQPMVSRGTFPVTPTKVGRRWHVLADVLIAHYKAQLRAAVNAPAEAAEQPGATRNPIKPTLSAAKAAASADGTVPKKRGRPSKADLHDRKRKEEREEKRRERAARQAAELREITGGAV